MEKYFNNIDLNIKRSIDLRKQIVIYPMGKMGIYAREILNKRYGREGIYVDNVQLLIMYNVSILMRFCHFVKCVR